MSLFPKTNQGLPLYRARHDLHIIDEGFCSWKTCKSRKWPSIYLQLFSITEENPERRWTVFLISSKKLYSINLFTYFILAYTLKLPQSHLLIFMKFWNILRSYIFKHCCLHIFSELFFWNLINACLSSFSCLSMVFSYIRLFYISLLHPMQVP